MHNASVEIAKSAPRTASFDVPIENPDCTGLTLVVDITANPGAAGGISVTVEGVDPVSGKKWPLLASVAMAAVGTIILQVGRTLTPVANLTANAQIPRKLNVKVAHANANPITYSIGGSLVL